MSGRLRTTLKPLEDDVRGITRSLLGTSKGNISYRNRRVSTVFVLVAPRLIHSREINLLFPSNVRNMIAATVFLLIMSQIEFRLAYDQNGNCHYDHIPLNFEGITNLFLCVRWCQSNQKEVC